MSAGKNFIHLLTTQPMKQHFNNGTTLAEFVLNYDTDNCNMGDFIDDVCSYAELLEIPLELGHFVPVKDGKVLSEPILGLYGNEQYEGSEMDEYQKAMAKVVFDGFELKQYEDKWITRIYNKEYGLIIDLHDNQFELKRIDKIGFVLENSYPRKTVDLLGKCKMK